MITVRILKDKWIPVLVHLPGQRPIRKPLFKDVVEYTDEVAKVLIQKGYVEPVEDIVSEVIELPSPVVTTPLSIETEALVEANSSKSEVVIEESEVLEVEDTKSTELQIIDYLQSTSIELIDAQIKGIGVATAKKLKAIEPMTWEEIGKVLNEKQIESLSDFLKI